MEFHCQVCFSVRTERLALPSLKTLNGDVIRAADCNHPICRDCMASFVAARLDEQRVFGIRCPTEGCKNELQQQDVQRLVDCGALSPSLGQRFAELRRRDYTARANAFTEILEVPAPEDYKMLRRLWATSRRCPRCNVILEKSEGCNSFGCICGHRFDFAKAPRACGDGIDHFDSVIDLAMQHAVPFKEAEQRVREARSRGIKRYNLVLKLAKCADIPLSLAELRAQAFNGHRPALEELKRMRIARKQKKTADLLTARLGFSEEDAVKLVERARAGDQAAWASIQQARRARDRVWA